MKLSSSKTKSSKSTASKKRMASGDDYDDDDEPSSKKPTKRAVVGTLGKGWGDWKQEKEAHSEFMLDMKLTAEDQLTAFLTPEPVATYSQHWIERPKGKQSWVCLKSVFDPNTGNKFKACPLCDIGNKPTPIAVFPVAVLGGSQPALMALHAKPMIMGVMEKCHADSRKGPLDERYYAMSMTKSTKSKGGPPQYGMNVVKERDIEDDWDCQPLDDKQRRRLLKEFKVEDAVQISTKKQLQEIAAEVTGDTLDDDDDD